MSEYITKLNEAQREAVINYQSPSLIVAGAGSGKTRVLTCRIAYMLEHGVDPSTVLALTFTNKAAAEMRERIGQLLSFSATRRLWMGTFHSIFSRILRAEADVLGYPSSYTIYDASDARNLVKTILKELNLSDETYKPNAIASRISLAKNNLITATAYEANASLQAEDREKRTPQFFEVYKRYVARCRQNGAMDFDDLLLNTNVLFKDHSEVLAKYQQMFHYILVDEYQDTNVAQYLIIRRLSEGHSKVCVVGDDAQSIYSFRGAKIENILRFKNDFPTAKVFKLEQNYRSTQTIVNAANSIIEKNAKQIRKHSFSTADVGDKIKVIKAYTDKEEALRIADQIADTVRGDGAPYSEVVILYRTNAQSRALEESLRGHNIPYKIYGGVSFYQRKEIKDLLGYIRLVVNPRDDEAFRRVINTPSRGIGDVTIGRIAQAAATQGLSLWEALRTMTPEQMEIRGAAGRKVSEFTAMVEELSSQRGVTAAYDLGRDIAVRSGLVGAYKMQQGPEALSALENIEELLNSIQAFVSEQHQTVEQGAEVPDSEVTIDQWLQNIALLTDMDAEKPEEHNKVTLMTVHGAKGLEFDYVFVAGLEENLFPSLMSMGTPEGLEEERRLFYVALTRARRRAVLSFAESRFKWGEMTFCRPSRFLGELDGRYLDIDFDESELEVPSEDESAEQSASRSSRYPTGGYGRQERGERRSINGGGATGGGYPRREATHETRPQPAPRPVTPDERRFRSIGSRVREELETERPQVTAAHEAADGATETTSSGALAVGRRVRHAKFGEGKVLTIEEWSGDTKVTVDFDGVGRKTLLSRFAKLTVVG